MSSWAWILLRVSGQNFIIARIKIHNIHPQAKNVYVFLPPKLIKSKTIKSSYQVGKYFSTWLVFFFFVSEKEKEREVNRALQRQSKAEEEKKKFLIAQQ